MIQRWMPRSFRRGLGWLGLGDRRLVREAGPLVASAVSRAGFDLNLLGDAVAVKVDGERAVETFLDLDPRGGVGNATVGRGRDVDHIRADGNRVVVEAHASILEEEELVQAAVSGHLNPGGLGFLGPNSKAPVASGQETPQQLVGLLAVAGPSQAQLAG